jgi:iron complex outermembrane receptor protein
MFDGMGLTGPGGTSYELFEPLGLRYTEVLRGANAFSYGAVTLGGAVNFVSRTGKTDPGGRALLQGGSFGYWKGQLAYGAAIGDLDFYISGVASRRRGFQEQTYKKNRSLSANIGYQSSDALSTRFYFRYAKEFHYQSGLLTLAQLRSDPRQTSAAFRTSRADVDKFGSYMVGNKTDYAIDDENSISFTANFYRVPQRINTKSALPGDSNYTDLNLSLRYVNSSDLFGRPAETTFGWFQARHLIGRTHTYSQALAYRLVKENRFKGSQDNVLALGNSTEIVPGFHLLSGISAIQTKRDVNIVYTAAPINAGQVRAATRDNWSWAPRIGFSLDAARSVQLFGNYSESVNPVASWGYSPSTYSTTLNYVKPLVEQKAGTFELGAKVQTDLVDGSIALYRSRIHNEFLLVEIAPATGTTAALVTGFNASPTVHQGIEAGLSNILWRGSGHALRLRQSYTFNDFHFRNDASFGDNRLPGVPRHFYQGELQFDHASGLYLAGTLQHASRYFVDYANSLSAPSYTIIGAKLGYQPAEGPLSAFIDFSNIGDRKYVAAISPIYNAAGKDTAAFYPGDGFNVVAGVTIRF